MQVGYSWHARGIPHTKTETMLKYTVSLLDMIYCIGTSLKAAHTGHSSPDLLLQVLLRVSSLQQLLVLLLSLRLVGVPVSLH